MIGSIIQLALSILMIVSMWKIFETFGQKGWACIIPFYNIIVMLRIAKWEPLERRDIYYCLRYEICDYGNECRD